MNMPFGFNSDQEKVAFDRAELGLILSVYGRMVAAGVPIKEVNLGGMGIRGERKPFIKNVAADPDEVVAIEQMRAAGVHVYYQLVPEQAVIEVDDALARAHEGE